MITIKSLIKSVHLIIIVSAMILNFNSLSAKQGNSQAPEVINIGSRLELFMDNYLIGKLAGEARLSLHHPVPREVAVLHDSPWEGSNCHYHTIFKDVNIYRMYYRGAQIGTRDNVAATPHPQVYCYAESEDGIHWQKPYLRLFDFNGSKENNIIFGFSCHSASMFKDDSPGATRDTQYKALVFKPKAGLLPYKSADGIHWSAITDTAVITRGSFDSQNVAFWDSLKGEYRAYWRVGHEGVRAIATATSKDFLHWSDPVDLIYEDSPVEHLYTNQIKPYYRAPHIFIGFPTRYVNRGWSASMQALPELEHRELRSISSERHGTAITEGLIMTSRDGVTFKRWNEAFLRPGIEREGTWNYGQQFIGWGMVETKSDLMGAPDELSIYALESVWTGTSDILRRYTLRVDGFVSVCAPQSGGELITRSLIFKGKRLVLNFSSSASGGIQVEIQDANGNPIPGFSLEECPPIFGDAIEREVSWKNGNDVSMLVGKAVKLRFVLKDADLYSLQFK